MHITPEIGTFINACIGIFISVFTAYLSYKIKQRDEETIAYRRDREQREEAERQRQNIENISRDNLTLGMARTMLLKNYDSAISKGYYTTTERDVYHELYTAYKGAGGNGVMDELAVKIVKLPTNKPKKERNTNNG